MTLSVLDLRDYLANVADEIRREPDLRHRATLVTAFETLVRDELQDLQGGTAYALRTTGLDLDTIASYFGRSEQTASRWVQIHTRLTGKPSLAVTRNRGPLVSPIVIE